MKKSFPLALLISAVCILTACGGDEVQSGAVGQEPDHAAELAIPDLGEGVYTVSSEQGSDLIVGKYTAGAGGARLLYFVDADEKVKTVLSRVDEKSKFKLISGALDSHTVLFKKSTVQISEILAVKAAAGSYQMRLQNSEAAEFTLMESGILEPTVGTQGSCKLQGSVSSTPLQNMLKLKVSTASCAILAPDFEGVMVLDSNEKPAAYRLLSTDSATLRDYWIYRN